MPSLRGPKKTAEQKQEPKEQLGIQVRLVPVENSDQPKLANYSSVNIAPGIAFLDFGFIEPSALPALLRAAKTGKELPKSINGKLAVRVALGFDGLQTLHQQIGRVIAGLKKKQTRKKRSTSGYS